jgi:hypothetical protein
MNYNNKKFRPVSSTENGEVDKDTIFEYKQDGEILTSSYGGGQIIKGHLIGIVSSKGEITMHYHQVNTKGQIMTGICKSIPELQASGKIRLYEKWEWTSGDRSKGESILQEI